MLSELPNFVSTTGNKPNKYQNYITEKYHQIMNKIITFLIALSVMLPLGMAAKDKKNEQLNYEISQAGVGNQGTYAVKVTVISKNKNVSDDLIARCAVHGALFRGVGNKGPIAGSASAEAQHADYFQNFFAPNGPARNYVSSVGSQREVLKVNKKEYRVTKIVSINKDQLRKDLEAAGVIRGLNSIF